MTRISAQSAPRAERSRAVPERICARSVHCANQTRSMPQGYPCGNARLLTVMLHNAPFPWRVPECVRAWADCRCGTRTPLSSHIAGPSPATVCPCRLLYPPCYQASRSDRRVIVADPHRGHVTFENLLREGGVARDAIGFVNGFCGEALGTSAALCPVYSHCDIAHITKGGLGHPLRPSGVAASRHTRQSVSAHEGEKF